MASHGDLIAGRYRISTPLGRGGMGTVWRADDELLGRAVAVKELHIGAGLSPVEAENRRGRTLREARSVAQVKNPGVLVLHDIVQHDEQPWLVMELIDGCSLADRIAEEGPVPPAEAARIGLALLAALRAAHKAGVLHRDIKPANVLLEAATGRVVLSDFGIAQVDGQTTLTETGAFVGSPEYTAPERMSGKRTGPESDLWSLGVLLCAAVEGESPFRRDSVAGVLHAVVIDEIKVPESAGPLLPVLTGLLERDPGRRLGTDEAERALRGFLAEERLPTVAHTPVPRESGAPPPSGESVVLGATAAPAARRRVRTAVLVGALVTVLAVGGTGAWVMTRDDSARGTEATEGGGSADKVREKRSEGATEKASDAPEPLADDTGKPAPKPSEEASKDASEPPADSAAKGYRTVSDPAGFTMAAPSGYVRSNEPPRVFYNSPDNAFRIGVHPQPLDPDGPVAVMRAAHESGPSNYPGYRNGSVRETTHNGFPAAVWEFTWDGGAGDGGPRHTYDLSWDEGGKMYDLWVSAPAGRAAEGERHFIEAHRSFARAGS
ncbi:serine/threonine-protein kinase [Streptomyces sp. IB2014 016-6]|uniref:serine/threonine-protein kinase n=1 Tax=Streptomyces sp. IB2014 016-6 TaxID=2517818 RepID=UPI0011C98079|nr:serine/threonine-protein kinase [Streptomyces sp. IB2014 016-6]TXL85795.1 serine/threonine protein kinase [Streptomyces sp. IB2014 016-6]